MVKKFIWIFFVLGAGAGAGYAQELSEKQGRTYYFYQQNGQFKNISQAKEGVDSLLTISEANLNIDLRKTLEAARQGLELAASLDYKIGKAYAHFLLGTGYQRIGMHMQSLQHFLTALEMFTELGKKESVGRVLNGIANFYLSRKNYDKAIEYYHKAISKFIATGSGRRKAMTNMNLGLAYFYQGKHEKSLKYYNRTLQALQNTPQNRFVQAVTITNMGNSYTEMGEYKKAEQYLLRAIEYFNRKELTRNQSGAYIYLAKLYNRWKRPRALEYARRGLQKAKSIGYKQYILEGYKLLADIYARKNEYRRAYRLYKQFNAVQDSLLNIEVAAKINKLQTGFKVQRKNQKIELLQKEAALKEAEIQQQRLWKTFMIIGFGFVVVIAGLLYRYNKQKKHTNALLEEKNEKITHQNEKLIELNEEKDDFLGIAAHDLRNPLSGIAGAAELLERDGLSRKEAKEYNKIIKISTVRMLSLIDNLLDVHAVENKLGKLTITETDLNEVIKNAVSSYQKTADKKNIALIAASDSDFTTAMADKGAVHRILDNLISNAIKYSKRGSTVKVGIHKKKDVMELSVKDNGPGIPEEEQEKLFKRHSRLSNKPTADEKSTGLGLFIVKRLAEKMNGSVKCISWLGEGTEFVVSLPLATEGVMSKES